LVTGSFRARAGSKPQSKSDAIAFIGPVTMLTIQ